MVDVDDGSNDYTPELMHFYTVCNDRIKYVTRPESRLKGANSCRNYGFEISKGEIINWFDSDDLMHPEKLELQINELKKNNLDFVVCQSLVFQGSINNTIGLRHQNIYSENLFEDYVQKKIFWGTIAPVWNKSFLFKFKTLFDIELHASQEWEFFSRLLSKSPKGRAIDKALVFIRYHEENITNKKGKKFTKWNYFLARYKVYQNNHIKKSPNTVAYLENYMLYYFKNITINRNFKYSIASYRFFILRSHSLQILHKLYGLLAIISYFVFNKGYFLLSKMDIKKQAN